MLFDSHCHLQFLKPAKQQEVVQSIEAQAMRVMCVGTSQADWQHVLSLAQAHAKNVFCALGLYPTELQSGSDSRNTIYDLRKLIEENVGLVKAIGETGLEYFHEKDPDKREEQKTLFENHITLAQKFSKPLIVHARDSYQDTYEILCEHKDTRFVMHSFLGSPEFLAKFLGIGGFISFNSIVLLASDYDETIRQAPLDRLLIETDSPFIRNNTPLDVARVAQKIAKIKGMAYDEVNRVTYANANAFFGLDR